MQSEPSARETTVDPGEIAKFERMASEWWSPTGKFRPLHKLNPVRLGFVRRDLNRRFVIQVIQFQ